MCFCRPENPEAELAFAKPSSIRHRSSFPWFRNLEICRRFVALIAIYTYVYIKIAAFELGFGKRIFHLLLVVLTNLRFVCLFDLCSFILFTSSALQKLML